MREDLGRGDPMVSLGSTAGYTLTSLRDGEGWVVAHPADGQTAFLGGCLMFLFHSRPQEKGTVSVAAAPQPGLVLRLRQRRGVSPQDTDRRGEEGGLMS